MECGLLKKGNLSGKKTSSLSDVRLRPRSQEAQRGGAEAKHRDAQNPKEPFLGPAPKVVDEEDRQGRDFAGQDLGDWVLALKQGSLCFLC